MAQNEYFKTIFELDGKQAENELAQMEQHAAQLAEQLKLARKENDLITFEKTKKELNGLDREIDKYKKNVVDVKRTLENLSGASLNDLLSTQKKITAEFSKMKRGSDDYVAASKKLQEVDTQIKKVRSEMRSASVTQESWMSKASNGFNKYFGIITAGLAVLSGFALSLKSIVTGNAQLDDSLADIRKTTGMTTEEVKQLNKQLGKVNTRTSREELRQIAIVAGQLGIAKDQVFGFTKSVDKLNVALGDEFTGGAEQVSKEMGALRNVFSDIKTTDVSSDMLHIGNAINELGAAGSATGPVMADFSNRIGGVGITLGLTSGQVLGMSATLQELNVNAERGGTAVSKIMQKMTTDTDKFAAVAGMDVKEFTKLVNTDMYGAFLKVVEGSQKSGTSATAMGKILDELGVDGAGASEVFTKLGKNTGLLQEKVDLANKSLKSTSSIMSEFDVKNNTLGAKLEKIGKNLKAIFVESNVKEALSGIVDGMYKWMGLNVSAELEKERGTVNGLAIQLMNANLSAEDRNRLYTELKAIAPDILAGLSAESLNYEQLRKNLEAYNNEMINKIVLARKDEEIEDQNQKVAKVRQNRMEKEQKVAENLYKIYDIIKLQAKNGTRGLDASDLKTADETLSNAQLSMEQKFFKFKEILSKSTLGYNAGVAAEVLNTLQAIDNLKDKENDLLNSSNKLAEERQRIADALKLSTSNTPDIKPTQTPDPNADKKGTPELTDEQKKAIEAAKKLAEEQRKAREELINSGSTDREKEYGRYREHLQKLGLMDTKYNTLKRKLTEEEMQAAEVAVQIHLNNLSELDKKEADEALKRKQEQLKKTENDLTEAHSRELDTLEIAENTKLMAEGRTDADRDRIHAEFNDKRAASELAFLLLLKKLYEDAGLNTVAIDKRISKERLAQYENGNKELQKLLAKREDLLSKYGWNDEVTKDEQAMDNEIALLQELVDKKLITEVEYLIARENIEQEFENKQFDRFKSHASSIASMFGDLSNTVTAAQDLQLNKVSTTYGKELAELDKKHKLGIISDEGYNKKKTQLEEKQLAEEKAIKKKYADVQFALQVAQIISSTAQASINAYAALSIIPVLGPALGVIGAGAAAAYGGIQIAQAKQQRDEAKAYGGGKYDVFSSYNGQLYNNVPVEKQLQSGIVKRPTLVAEEPEIVMSIRDTRFAMMNYPQLLNDIQLVRSGVVPQRANGKYTDAITSADTERSRIADIEFNKQLALNNMFLEMLLTQGVEGHIYFDQHNVDQLTKEIDKLNRLKSLASR